MKKQLIAKLLVLGMVLAMLPVTALAATVTVGPGDIHYENGAYYAIDPDTGIRYPVTSVGNGTYSYEVPDVTPIVPETPVTPSTPDTSSTEAPAEEPVVAEPVVVETIENVKTETNDEGQVVATATIKVEVQTETNAAGETIAVASVVLTEAAVADLSSQLADTNANVVVLTVDAKDADKAVVAVPAAALTSFAAETSADLTVASTVAEITVPNAILAALPANAQNVEITAEKNADGTIAIALLADGKAVDLSAGLPVAIPVTQKAENVAGVYLVTANGREQEIKDWEITEAGTLKLTITANGSIRIAEK